MAEDNVTAELLRQRYSYDPETGSIWIKSGRCHGMQVGNSTDRGYIRVRFQGTEYKVHRIAWLFSYGEWPKGQVDHINRIRSDNRLVNLRVVTLAENRQNEHGPHSNNRLGIRGVRRTGSGTFWASIGYEGKQYSLGSFKSAEEASDAYKSARARLHKFSPEAAQSLGDNLNSSGFTARRQDSRQSRSATKPP